MLFDPDLVDRVYDGATVPTLDEHSRSLLVRADRRAWKVDPYRRTRALTALIEEFPASAAQAGVPRLDAFFSSDHFHTTCQERGSMALSFGQWIEALAGPIARLESALARVRRPQPMTVAGVGLAPSAALASLPAGVLDQYQALRAQLGENPVHALVEGRVRPVALPKSESIQRVLVFAQPNGDISLTMASDTLAELLLAADPAVDRQTLRAKARDLGADPGEEDEIIDDLIADGLLVAI